MPVSPPRSDRPNHVMTAFPAVTNDAPMARARPPYQGTRVDSAAWPLPRLLDDVLAAYVDWREDADAASDAYRRWADAHLGERAARFSAYNAALDQEEYSATAYARVVAELERRLPAGIVQGL